MTRNIDTQLIQTGSWRSGGVYNSIGGPKSSPEPFSSPPVTNVSMRVTTRRNGGNTPGYNSRQTGAPPLKPTMFSFYHAIDVSQAGHVTIKSLSPPTTYDYVSASSSGTFGSTSNIPSFRGPDSGEIGDCSAKASNKLLNGVKNQVFNAAQAFAERKRTANLIGTTAIRIASAIRHLRKGDFAGAANAVGVEPRKRAHSRFRKAYARRQGEAVSRGWLELQYGWKPLLNDIYGSAKTLAETDVQIAYKTMTRKEVLTIDLGHHVSTTSGKLKTSSHTSGQCKLTVTYSVMYCTPDPTQSLPAQLGLTNPLLIAWELMPFSFVVDWFLPLGQAISNLDATRGAEFYSGYKTVYWEASAVKVATENGVDSYNRTASTLLTSNTKAIFVERTALSGFPTPSMPRFKNPATFLHAANGLALLTQLFRKR